MNTDQIAWAAWCAGLFEGEGSAGAYFNSSNKGHGSGYRRPALRLAMTDEEPVRRFHKIVGRGTVRALPPLPSGKTMYAWQCTAKEDVKWIIEYLLPFMCERRTKKFNEVLAECSPRDGWATRRERYGPRGHS